MSEDRRKVLLEATRLIIRPIARYCLLRSIKFQEFLQLSKEVFLEVAKEELKANELNSSISRLSVMTGLQRREISRLVDPRPGIPERSVIARVVGQWASDKQFIDKRGKPRDLAIEGKASEFARLVAKVSQDLNHHTLLFELERLGSVVRVKGHARLIFPAYIPKGNPKEIFEMLSEDTEELIASVDENIFSRSKIPNLHAKTYYDNIAKENVPEIRSWFLKFGQRIHEEARRYLSKFDRDINSSSKESSGRMRVVLGTFSNISEFPKKRRLAELPNKKGEE